MLVESLVERLVVQRDPPLGMESNFLFAFREQATNKSCISNNYGIRFSLPCLAFAAKSHVFFLLKQCYWCVIF